MLRLLRTVPDNPDPRENRVFATTSADVTNPWVQSRAAPTHSGELAPTPSCVGPTAPQPGLAGPDAVHRLAHRPVSRTARLWWVGVHGGAGEDTLATLLEGSAAAGHAWPAADGQGRLPVVLTSRTHLSGLLAAQRAALAWAAGQVPNVQLLGMVLVPDAPGRLPRALRDLARVVAGGLPRVWQLPWVEEWRTADAVDPDRAPRAARRLVADLSHLLAEQVDPRKETPQ